MGSERYARLGIGRSQEGALDYPTKYTVIGVDTDAAVLIKRYAGTKNAQYAADIIGAVVQKYRTAKPPPRYFVNSLTGGVNEPVVLCDLGPDAKGKSWAVVVDGRQRVLGLRIVNEENVAARPALPRLMLAGVFRAFAHKGAGLAAAMVKAVSNVHVAMTPSQRADDAVDLNGRGVGLADIATAVGARDVAEVNLLLVLADCHEDVKVAVDTGKIGLAAVADLSKHKPEEQARRVARKDAGPGRAGKDAAAPPRVKALARPVAEAMAEQLTKTRDFAGNGADVAALVRYVLGDREQANGRPWLVTLGNEAAEAVRAAKGGAA